MRKFIVLQLILVTISSFGQSPWTQKKGKVFSHLSFSTISGYNSLFGNPDFNTERKISDKTLQLFTEYGVSDKTSLLINIPFKMIETGALVNEVSAEITTSSNKNTFGNINIGLELLDIMFKKDIRANVEEVCMKIWSNCSIDEYIEKYHPYCIYGKHGMFGNMTSEEWQFNKYVRSKLKDFDEILFHY